MNELQIGLLALAVLCIVLVMAYNAYQEWRFKKKTRQSFAAQSRDALLETPQKNVRDGHKDRLEPIFAGEEVPASDPREAFPFQTSPSEPEDFAIGNQQLALDEPNIPVVNEAIDDAYDEIVEDFPEPKPATVAQPLPAAPVESEGIQTLLLDPTLDFIAEIQFAESQEISVMPRFQTPKRVQILARFSKEGAWVALEAIAGMRYQALQIGLQLVDRSGAITESDLNRFCDSVEAYAMQLKGRVHFPNLDAKLEQAAVLDNFCAQVDVLLGMNVLLDKPLQGTKIRQYCEYMGMEFEPDGSFHYLNDAGDTIYALASGDETAFSYHTLPTNDFNILTLLFDVPRVAGGIAMFDSAMRFTSQLIQEFGGQLADDNGRIFTDDAIAKVRHQLVGLYQLMDKQGIRPGSPAALRLFA